MTEERPNICLACKGTNEASRSFCGHCGALTRVGSEHFDPHPPRQVLAQWQGGSLYHRPQPDQHQWLFIYDESIVHTPAFARLQQEDLILAQVPHPILPSQLERGMLERRPYVLFQGHPEAIPLSRWEPALPAHVRLAIFSRLSDLSVLLGTEKIQRPTLDPHRILVFWDDALELYDFRWLPLPDLGASIPHKGTLSRTFKDSFPPGHLLTTPTTPLPKHKLPSADKGEEGKKTRSSFPRMSPLPSLKKRGVLTKTDEFELMSILDRLEESGSADDLRDLGKRLAELEVATRIPEKREDSGESTNPELRAAQSLAYPSLDDLDSTQMELPFPGEDIEDITESSILHRVELRYSSPMQTHGVYPLRLSIGPVPSEQKLQTRVRVTPTLPGCLVSPQRITASLTTETTELCFWITPLAQAPMVQGHVQLQKDGQGPVALPLALKTHSNTPQRALVVGAAASALSKGLLASSALQLQSGSLLHLFADWGLLFAALFALAAVALHGMRRPQEQSVKAALP